jgi:hypothetical protein
MPHSPLGRLDDHRDAIEQIRQLLCRSLQLYPYLPAQTCKELSWEVSNHANRDSLPFPSGTIQTLCQEKLKKPC